jgi:hypothetical protein
MRVALDTHIHIYPYYAVEQLLTAAQRQLHQHAPGADRYALCLTERAGHTAFADLAAGTRTAPGWTFHATAEKHLLRAQPAQGAPLYMLAGRQIITAERLEILALGTDERISDGQPVRTVLELVHRARALPVLPWGLGKWLGARGTLVSQLVNEAQPGDVALADTYLLPALAPRPSAVRQAATRGFRILAGTDLLDRSGEEILAGRYGVQIEGPWNDDAPAAALLDLLRDPRHPLRVIGRRGSLLETLKRMR